MREKKKLVSGFEAFSNRERKAKKPKNTNIYGEAEQ